MEIWSLTRFPDGVEHGPGRSRRPRRLPTTPSWPPIPGQDFANIPKQQAGLHSRSVEFMRLAEQIEGLISNFERVVDGYLAGLPDEQLVPAIQQTNTTDRRAHRRLRLLGRDYEAVPVRRSRSLVAYLSAATSSYTMTWSAAAVVY